MLTPRRPGQQYALSAHDELHNNAVVIHELLRAKPRAANVPIKATNKMRRKT
jgi:hypothetical protein